MKSVRITKRAQICLQFNWTGTLGSFTDDIYK